MTYRFPLIIESMARLRSGSCIIDGEAVACGDDGAPNERHVFLCAFHLIELNGDDRRRDPLDLSRLLGKAHR